MGNYFQNLAALPRGNTPLRPEPISARVFIVMKHITTITSVLAALLVLAAVFATANVTSASENAQTDTPSALAAATEPAPLSATEAVFYVSGILDAQTDGATRLAEAGITSELTPSHVPFRHMAYTNALTASLLRAQGYTIPAAYLQGRADAFKALADLLGEP